MYTTEGSWDIALCVWDEPFKDHSLETAKMVPRVTVLAIQLGNGDQINTIHLRSLAWSRTCLEHRALVNNPEDHRGLMAASLPMDKVKGPV